MLAAIPPNEALRLAALQSYSILDSAPEPAFDRFCSLATRIFRVPIATVTFIDAERQWHKSKVGISFAETSRDISFCAHAILGREVFVINDATKDPRFSQNPLVLGPPHVRFYAGAPLTDPDGLNLGTLCISDTAPREFAAEEERILADLAALVVDEMRLRIAGGQISTKLHAAQAKYRSIFENALDGIFQTSADGRYLDANPALARMYGYASPEQMLSCILDIEGQLYVDPRRRTEFVQQMTEFGTVTGFVSQVRSCDGRVLWISENARSVRDSEGNFLYYEGIVKEITAAKESEALLKKSHAELEARVVSRTEELTQINRNLLYEIAERERTAAALRELNARKDAILEAALDGIITIDHLGKTVELNSAAYRMFGYAKEEAAGMDLHQFITPPEGIADFQLSGDGALFGKRIEVVASRKDGTRFPAELAISRIQIDGRPMATGHIHEITARKQMMAELKKAKEDAETANKAKSVFLASMSHEIRTPLNAILGFSQVLQHDSALTGRQKEYLNIINRSGEHLLAVINDILEVSKIEAGLLALKATSFDLHALLNDIKQMFFLQSETKRIAFSVDCSSDLPRYVMMDRNKLFQILVNLAGNAMKFTAEGSVQISASAIRVPGAAPRLTVEVADTGSGISNEEIAKLFRYFEQTSSGRKSGVGTGLGLAISREFVRLMGGDIYAASEPGKGSVFCFSVPFSEHQERMTASLTVEPVPVALKAGQPPYRILIVDDKEENRMLLKHSLDLLGFATRQAADGEKAVQEFLAWRPHLVLMDMLMPVMAGASAIRAIRSSAGGSGVKIIALTAAVFEENRAEAFDSGADEFIAKPLRKEDLLAKIGRLLGSEYAYKLESTPSSAGLASEQAQGTAE